MNKYEQLKRELSQRVLYRGATKLSSHKETKERAVQTENNSDATFILISENNETNRYDWWSGETFIEELDVKGADFSELKTFFKDHNPSVDNAIGKVEDLRIEGSQLLAGVSFGSDDNSQTIKQKYNDEILTDVSIGYRINELILTEKKGEPDHVLVTDYSIVELSAVWKGADSGAIKIKNDAVDEVKERRFSYDLYEKKLNSIKGQHKWI